MSSVPFQHFPTGTRVLHWIACLLGTAFVSLFMMFVVAEMPPVAVLLDPQAWALLLMLFGFLVAWRNDLAGGAMSVLGAAAFYLLNYEKAGNFPGGWVFPVCFVPGVLAIMAGLMRSRIETIKR
jgi:hypothetical protein